MARVMTITSMTSLHLIDQNG